MTNIQFKFCRFNENVINQSLNESLHKTLFVHPTKNSKRAAIRTFQKKWAFENTAFKTMEEFKDELFVAAKPILKEEKRTLAFYTSLSDQHKRFFNINNYFQSIIFAHNFFSLWGEFNDERVDENFELDLFFHNDSELLDWQIATYKNLVGIKKNYFKFIDELGFQDKIQQNRPENLNIERFYDYDRIVFVNQFYYTNLEKSLIKQLQEQVDVIIYYQLPEFLLDKETLDIRPFALDQLKGYANQNITISSSPNDFTMMQGLLHSINQHNITQIVDVDFFQNPYSRYFSNEAFNLGSAQSFSETTIYHFFATTYELLNSIVWETDQKKLLLSVEVLLQAVINPVFINYFSGTESGVLDYLVGLLDDDYKYIDLDGEAFSVMPKHECVEPIRGVLNYLSQFLNLTGLKQLVEKIDEPFEGIQIRELISDHERDYTDTLEIFYKMLADFAAIEELGIVKSWDEFFDTPNPFLKNLKTSCGLLKLFNDYIKLRTITLNVEPGEQKKIDITNVVDTRNIAYSKIAVLNVVENKLPTSPKPQFLFTEKQRAILGLKTYEDIKLREKYYFFRLVLTTPQVFLFTQKNIDENITPSSFIEEILLTPSIRQNKLPEARDQHYAAIFNEIFTKSKDKSTLPGKLHPTDFCIPFDAAKDIPAKRLDISFYNLSLLLENPFAFYVNHLAKIKEKPKQAGDDFSPKLIGNLVHDMFTEIFRLFLERVKTMSPQYDFSSLTPDEINGAFDKVMAKWHYYYKTPHHYAKIYFDEILSITIKKGIQQFFSYLHNDLKLSHKALNIIPEKEYAGLDERTYKTFINSAENKMVLDLGLRGRADLRIVNSQSDHLYIFDYKTGKHDKEQLILYELYYHLLDHPEDVGSVSSYFYLIFNEEMKDLEIMYRRRPNKDEIINGYKSDIITALNAIVEKGWYLPEHRTKQKKAADISRADVYTSVKRGEA